MDRMLFLMLLACSVTGAPPALFPLEPPNNYIDFFPPETVAVPEKELAGGLSGDRLEELEDTLNELLRTGDYPPIVFLEDEIDPPSVPFPAPEGFLQAPPNLVDGPLELENDEELLGLPRKRSRYYRRYTGKRQTKYYSPDNYLCSPTRDDVYRLLVALHEVRNGTMDKTVHFCNRRRPAKAVFTNIRFLGKRR